MTNFSKVSKMGKVSKQAIQEAAIYLLKLKTQRVEKQLFRIRF